MCVIFQKLTLKENLHCEDGAIVYMHYMLMSEVPVV